MKRPDGFDPASRVPAEPPGRKPAKPKAKKAIVRSVKPAAPKTTGSSVARPPATPPVAKPAVPKATVAATPREDRAAGRPARPRRTGASRRPVRPDAAVRAELRRVARERRRFERAEVRRFTRRARNRRLAAAVVAGVVMTLIGLVVVAIYSPLLALRTIRIDGVSRVDTAQVQAVVSGQIGRPLALVDFGRITAELAKFPLIRSYVTETVPPDTLVIHIVERQPVGEILIGGVYRLVDPAGVTVAESTQRAAGVPLIDLGGATTSTPAFDATVRVLLALPPALLAKVDSITAHTQDDVSLVLAGVGQRVRWGNAEQSDRKAALLNALIAVTNPSSAGVFDVSAPSNGIFHPN